MREESAVQAAQTTGVVRVTLSPATYLFLFTCFQIFPLWPEQEQEEMAQLGWNGLQENGSMM
jgi:hypothetical protein